MSRVKTLVVAEKPSVARDLADALPGSFTNEETHYEGDEYVVTFAVGHLVQLVDPEVYDEKLKKWRMADLPIVPEEFKLAPRDAKAKKQLKAIHKLMKRDDVDRIINACDAGREGELIFAYIYETAGIDKPVQRLWVSSMTKQAIREGFERLRPGEELQPLEAAARSRSEADWLIGMNATRAATIRGRAWVGGVVSLGRVQTPTLAMMVKREREIQAFTPEPYRLVRAQFDPRYEGMWFEGNETRIFGDLARAEQIVDKVTGKDGTVEKMEQKEQSERPPLLYDLTSLQRDANRRFGFSARRTLQAAQSLYEDKKAITYPRTSSRYLSGDLVPQLKPTAETLLPIGDYTAGARYVLGLDQLPLQRVVNDARVDDHHAIIPTDVEHDVDRYSPDERRIFDLVARRFLAVFHPAARYQRTEVVTVVEEERFRTRGKITLEPGWRGVYGLESDLDKQAGKTADEDAGDESAELPKLAQGQSVKCVKAEFEDKQTKPPPRYTEATLLSAMETAGKRIDDEELREAMKRRRGAARGDEGFRARHPGDACRDDRGPDPSGVHRACRQGAPADTEGLAGNHDARGAPAHLARADRRLGEAPLRHRARERRPQGVHQGHRRPDDADRRADRRARQGEAPPRARRARPVPALRRRDGRDHQGELACVRLHELEEPRGARLRLRDLEARRRPDDHARSRAPADRERPHERSAFRFPVEGRQTFPRAPRLER